MCYNDCMNDQIDIIESPQSSAVTSSYDDMSVKRIIAEAMRHGGLKEVYVSALGGKKVSYIEWLSTMVWDGVTEGVVTFADGTQMDLREDKKIWMELVKFLASHLDGAVNTNAQFSGVNIFKIYKGIDPDRI